MLLALPAAILGGLALTGSLIPENSGQLDVFAEPGAFVATEPEPAPDFDLTLFDGQEFSLSGHLASDRRPVLLNLWASWCVPCREEMPLLEEGSRRHPEVLFLGVAVEDELRAARTFAEEVGVTYPLALDETGTLLAKYPTFGLPTTWFISSDGMVVGRVIGAVTEPQLEGLLTQHFGSE
ncbi:MAG: TlpA family protein disulfide reductase [Actinomycetota bacterium]|nr:TlpA family protein disulfide reductase [Actinomycetota bacterium]